MLAAIALLIFSTAIAPQTTARTIGVSVAGAVQDQTGAILQGAKVSLEGTAGPSESIVSDTSGTFRFDRVVPGSYVIRTEFPGFKTASVRIRVGSRAPAPTTIVMAIEGLTQELSVTSAGQASADAAGNLNAITVDAAALDTLPIMDDDIVGAVSRFLDASAIGTSGSTLLVDGVEVSGMLLTPSAIQQIKINQNPYAAEFMRPGRGRIEIVTKPGGRDYSGTLNLRYRDSDFNARNAFATTKPEELRRTLEGNFGGPVPGTQKTSFMVSGSYSAEDNEAILFAQTLAGPVTGNVPVPSRNLAVTGTWNHMTGTKHIQSVRLSHLKEDDRAQGIGGFNLPELASHHENRETELTFSEQTVISPRLLNEFRILGGVEREPRVSARDARRIVVQDAFSAGGAQSDTLRTEKHFTLVEALTWSSGRHTVKGGINVPDWSWRGFEDLSNTRGTFSFASLQDYAAGRPYAFTQQAGDGHVAFLEKVIGLFVEDEIRLRPNLSIDAGLRFDWQNYFHDDDNFAPRFSLAYAAGTSRRTVLRGGAGIFYDRTGEGPIRDLIRYDGHHLSRYVLVDPGYPDPLLPGQSLSSQPSSLVVLSPDVAIPRTLQYSLGVERQLRPRTTLAINFVGSRGFSTFRSRDVNAPPPPSYSARPDPSHSVIRQIESEGRLQTASLQVTLRGQMTRYFNGSAEYAYGRAYNDTNGINWMPPNNYDLSLEYARADFNQEHRVELIGSFTPGKKLDFGLSTSAGSGRPYSLTTGLDAFNTGIANARPAAVPRNSLTGPSFVTVDMRWSREFEIPSAGKKRTITPAVDAFNILNHVNFNTPVGNLSSPFFGQSTSAQAPRRLQFLLRVRY